MTLLLFDICAVRSPCVPVLVFCFDVHLARLVAPAHCTGRNVTPAELVDAMRRGSRGSSDVMAKLSEVRSCFYPGVAILSVPWGRLNAGEKFSSKHPVIIDKQYALRRRFSKKSGFFARIGGVRLWTVTP